MKACEYPGWIELEEEDIVLNGDTWNHAKFPADCPPTDDLIFTGIGQTLGWIYKRDRGERAYRAFRRDPDYREVRPKNPFAIQPLPLP